MATAPSVERATPRHHKEITSEDKVLRGFRGVNVTGPRESIDDDEFYWLENVMPKSAGNLPVVYAPNYMGINYSQALLFECTAVIGGIDYIFSFLADGSATYITDTVPYVSTQFAVAGTFTAPFAIAYASNAGTPGLLIIDPSKGYFDFGITTALTLTSLSNSVTSVTESAGNTNFPQFPNVNPPNQRLYTVAISGGGGTALAISTSYTVAFMGVLGGFAGTGYSVGDVIAYAGASGTTAATATVTSVSAGGAVASLSLIQGGVFPGPNSAATVQLANPTTPTTTNGVGTGLQVFGTFKLLAVTVTNPGRGYTSVPTVTINVQNGPLGAPSVFDPLVVTVSGSLNGTSLAAYAGRVWVGSGKVISFTDINSYNSFGGVGGSLTVNDSYLHNAVTALFSTNGFLYIFGDDSIDTLSNVQVNAGVTSFSRVNLTTSIGTSYPQSIFPYYRSLVFGNKYGFYLLSGATPQKISDSLDTLFNTGTLTTTEPVQFVGGLVAGSATIFGELCMCWTVRIVDGLTTLYGTNITRTLIVCFFKGKWFFHYPGFDVGQMVAIPAAGTQVLHAFSTAGKLYELFAINSSPLTSYMVTKLWDGGDPILDKEVIRASVARRLGANVNQTLSVTTDNEYGSQSVPSINSALQTLTFVNNTGGVLQFQNSLLQNIFFTIGLGAYNLVQGASKTQGGKYFGMSVTAYQTDMVFTFLAAQFRATRPW